jgi:hypothetical protein
VKIINTFVPQLRAFKFSSVDELERNLDLWTNTKYLYEFFEKNKSNLSFFDVSTVAEAVEKTLLYVEVLRDNLIELVYQKNPNIDSLFHNLNDNEYKADVLLSKQKSKSGWLRLYAIKVEGNIYVITGGAIKLTEKMSQSDVTIEEQKKLDLCRNYLKDEGIYDELTLMELMI